jgi:hypothetical protein
MTSIWLVVLPLLFAAGAFLFLLAKNLRFFSRAARHLDQIDISNEISEISVYELEGLVGGGADFTGKTTLRERHRAITARHREIRKRLRLLISNCALFCEVARVHIREMDPGEADSPQGKSGLPLRVMDRAAIVQFMAAACLVKLILLDCCRAVCPLYVPHSANHFQLRGHDLVAGYRHLGKEVLELAKQYYDDITYKRLIFQLTGAFTIQEAAELSPL